jgi:heptose I phosphotransferase
LRRGGPRAGALLAEKLAELVGKLHRAGSVHRDLYASHVFLHESGGSIELYLIDLARLFAPRWRTFRWRVKDLAQLKYSMPSAWVEQHWEALLRRYLECTGRGSLARYNRGIDRKVRWIARRGARERARAAAGGGA